MSDIRRRRRRSVPADSDLRTSLLRHCKTPTCTSTSLGTTAASPHHLPSPECGGRAGAGGGGGPASGAAVKRGGYHSFGDLDEDEPDEHIVFATMAPPIAPVSTVRPQPPPPEDLDSGSKPTDESKPSGKLEPAQQLATTNEVPAATADSSGPRPPVLRNLASRVPLFSETRHGPSWPFGFCCCVM